MSSKTFYCSILCSIIVFSSCKKKEAQPPVNLVNTPLTAGLPESYSQINGLLMASNFRFTWENSGGFFSSSSFVKGMFADPPINFFQGLIPYNGDYTDLPAWPGNVSVGAVTF